MLGISQQYLLAQIFTVGNAIIDFILETDWHNVVFWLKVASGILSAGLVYGIGWTLKKHRGVAMAMWHKSMGDAQSPGASIDLETRRFEHDEWVRVKKLWASRSADDKRLAIIDADALLDNGLRELAIEGQTMAERLANPDAPHLANLNEVAFAHRYRNELVHEPGTPMDPLDADRAMKAYESALRELHII
ncbi:MAG: hypothetical protein Q8Q39_01620 [bacterium]|nr:hypothetical protein [bacterium]